MFDHETDDRVVKFRRRLGVHVPDFVTLAVGTAPADSPTCSFPLSSWLTRPLS